MNGGAHPEAECPAAERCGQLLLERYRVGRLVGAGGMGTVYEAEHVLIRRRVAIKFLRPELMHREAMLERFRREAEAAGRLCSDHIAAVTDWGQAPDGAPFIVMELLQGETLAARVAREGRLVPSVAAEFVLQACHGAERAHEAGIIHCDIKPHNLFIVRRDDGSEQVKLLDFGVARLYAGHVDETPSTAGRALGTPSYMSPEQAAGEENIDVRTDVYSLGVVLYHALSGRLPHPGSDPLAVRCRIARDLPVPLDAIQPELDIGLVHVVNQAMARDRRLRYASVDQFGSALSPYARPRRPQQRATDRRISTCVETLTDSITLPTVDREQAPAPKGSHWRHAIAPAAAITLAVLGVAAGWLVNRPMPRATPGATSGQDVPSAQPSSSEAATQRSAALDTRIVRRTSPDAPRVPAMEPARSSNASTAPQPPSGERPRTTEVRPQRSAEDAGLPGKPSKISASGTAPTPEHSIPIGPAPVRLDPTNPYR
ncbi:MAG: protein kinase [Polyangiaceae bacterium]|nr:protein kinase [Polyangiaceae bacterium]